MLTYDVSSLGSAEFDRTVYKSASFSRVFAKLTAFQFPTRDGVRLIPVQLIPEFPEDQDYSPIALYWNGELLGHLPEELAREYQQILRLSASRCVATSLAKISEDGEELSVSLRSSGLLLPLNNPPRDPYALLPATTSLNLTHQEGLEHILVDYLPPDGLGLLLVTLHNVEVLNERNRQAVEARLDGQRIGELAASETKNFKGIISHYAGLGMLTTATAQISGTETFPTLRVTTTPAKLLTTSLLRPPNDHPLPTLAPFAEDPREYNIPEDFNVLQLLSDAVVRIPSTQHQGFSAEGSGENTEFNAPLDDPMPDTENREPNPEPTQPAPTQLEAEAQLEGVAPPEFFAVSSVADNHVVLMEPAPRAASWKRNLGSSNDTQVLPLSHYEPPFATADPDFNPVSVSPATITFGGTEDVDKEYEDSTTPREDIDSEEFSQEKTSKHTLAIIGLIVGALIFLFGALHAVTSNSMLFFLGMLFLALSAFAPALWWFYCEYTQRTRTNRGGGRYWPLVALGAVASACAGIFITWAAVTDAEDATGSDTSPKPTILPELTANPGSSETATTSSEAPIAATEISLEPTPGEELSPFENDQDSPSRDGTGASNEQHRSEQPGGNGPSRTVMNPQDHLRDTPQPQYTYITIYPEEDEEYPQSGGGVDEVITQYETVEEEPVDEMPASTPTQPAAAPSASASQPAAATSHSAR